jgi:hypothetical protein
MIVQPDCSPFGRTRIWKVKITAVLMLIVDADTRDCSLDSIDARCGRARPCRCCDVVVYILRIGKSAATNHIRPGGDCCSVSDNST